MYWQKLKLENLLCIVRCCLCISCLFLRVSATLYCVASVCWMLLLGRTTHECKYWGGCKLNVVTQLQKYEIKLFIICLLVHVQLHMWIVPHSSASAPVSFVRWLIPSYLIFQMSELLQPCCSTQPPLPNNTIFPNRVPLWFVYMYMQKNFTFANSAFLGGGVRVRVWIREQRKIKKKIKGTIKPLVANLDITQIWVLC